MFLKSLTITGDSGVIREIKFRRGVNLIVDETPVTDEKKTGNNVGKTTVLMLIDYCLGSSGKGIYTDPENRRNEYKLVKDFLINNKVLVTLVLKADLSDSNSSELKLERNFLARSKIIRRINDIDHTEESFDETITNYLFPGHFPKKPTYRQIISHNIRYQDLSNENTLRTLDKFTPDVDYETLHLFMFGCDFEHGDLKQELLSKIKTELTFKNRLEQNQTKAAYETALSLTEEEIKKLDTKKANFNLNVNFEADLDKLNEVKYRISFLSSELGRLNIRRSLILESEQDLRSNKSSIDIEQLRLIYKQATEKVSGIQKTFEELYNFHNSMIVEKIAFITKDLPKLEASIKSNSAQLSRYLEEEVKLSEAITLTEPFEELEKIINLLNDKFRQKGDYENTIRQLSETESNLDDLNNELNKIDDVLFSEESEIKIKLQLSKFNKFFSEVSQSLYGEQYAVVANTVINKNGQRLYKFSAFNTNISSGKKQGEITCFDIAYILFADQENVPCLHFLLYDKKELMHDNQLIKLANLVNDLNIQFVASMLKDKLPEELNKEEYFILKLSQSDKLFRIESSA